MQVKMCKLCKKELINRYSNTIFCSRKCISREFYLRNRENELRKSKKKYHEVLKHKTPPVKALCKMCNTEFRKLGAQLYCSSKCSTKAYKIRTNRNCKKYNSKIYYGEYAEAHRALLNLNKYLKTMEA